jgi:Fe-S oxidoreductase
MSHTFTLEGSGHNPRPTKAHRLKNRVGHKFSYYPDLHKGVIACCGCGRCIKQCPAGVDIRQIVKAAQEYSE